MDKAVQAVVGRLPTAPELTATACRVLELAAEGFFALSGASVLDAAPASQEEEGRPPVTMHARLAAALAAGLKAAESLGSWASGPLLVKACGQLLRRSMPEDTARSVKPALLQLLVDLLARGPAEEEGLLVALRITLCELSFSLCDELSRGYLRRLAEGQSARQSSESGPEAWLAATVVSLVHAARSEFGAGESSARLPYVLAVLGSLSLHLANTAQDLRSFADMSAFGDGPIQGGDIGFAAFGQEAPAHSSTGKGDSWVAMQ